MATRREITKMLVREYAKASKAAKGRCWTRWWPRPRKYSHDAMVVLQEAWRLTGHPSGKYPAAVVDDTLERLLRFRDR